MQITRGYKTELDLNNQQITRCKNMQERQMSYKSAWQGEALFLADRWFPSTKMCSGCGHIKEDMNLSKRIYGCDNLRCLLVIERDLNAALSFVELTRKVAVLAKRNPTRSLASLFHEVKFPSLKQEPNRAMMAFSIKVHISENGDPLSTRSSRFAGQEPIPLNGRGLQQQV